MQGPGVVLYALFMPFSATTAATKQLDKVTAHCRKTNNGSQNCWLNESREYMYELSPTLRTGGVKGEIFEIRNGRAFKEGVFNITAEGVIIAFPFLPEGFFN
jgi:hypothetical protein